MSKAWLDTVRPTVGLSKAWFDLCWLDTVRPNVGWPLTTEKLLIVLQWLAPSERDARWHRRERRGTRTPSVLLSANFAYTSGVEPIRSIADLQARFRYIVLARCGPAMNDPVQAWREHHKIALDSKRRFRAVHGGPGWNTALEAFLRFDVAQLQVSLNYIHRGAREFEGVGIGIVRDGAAVFRVHIGLEGSRWEYELTRQRSGEPVGVAAVRAIAMLRALAGRGDAPFVGEHFGADAQYAVCVDEQGPLTSEHRRYGEGWRVLSGHATRAEAEDAVMVQIAASANAHEKLARKPVSP